ncbi:hypothetical protein ACO1O0_003131 [Amphichorda felina]
MDHASIYRVISSTRWLKYSAIISTALVAAFSLAARTIEAKAAYAHYMIGTVDSTTDHAKQDIVDAQAMGFDGFALNVRLPNEDWAISCIDQLFAAAAGTGFKLFFSLDMNGNDDVSQFASLFSHFTDDAYLKVGDDARPFVSTFWGGRLGPDVWKGLKDEHNMYFVPSFDDIEGYYDDPQGFFARWGDIVDGAFNWETAWPAPGDTPANVSSTADEAFQQAAVAASKDFMMSISPLQYKHLDSNHYYRIGEGNLPERMTQILALGPELVEFITWNDAGESHYIGHIWEEGVPAEILQYANTDDFPHYDWQPLLTSFIRAFKDGADASQMIPPSSSGGSDSDTPIGAMWYRGVLKSCTSGLPDNAQAAVDAVNYALVLPASLEGAAIRVTSGGSVLSETAAVAGLNYATVGGIVTGAQKLEVLSGDTVVATAAGGPDVQGDQPEFCNFNYLVVGLE